MNSPQRKEISAKSYLEKGLKYASLNELDKGKAAFKKAIEADESMAEAYNNLAAINIKQGSFEQAKKHASKANELNPDINGVNWMIAIEGSRLTQKIKKNPTPELYTKRGLLSFHQGAYITAQHDFENAIALNPSFTVAYGHLGDVCLKLGLPAEAEEAFDDGGDRAPEFDNNQLTLIKQWRLLERKLKLKPTAHLCNELGELYLEQNTVFTYKKAKKYFEKALDLDNAYSPAQNNLNAVHEKLSDGALPI